MEWQFGLYVVPDDSCFSIKDIALKRERATVAISELLSLENLIQY